MSYLSKRNALYGGIVAFFFSQKSAFLVILDMLNIAYPGLLFFFMETSDEDILDVSKLFSDILKDWKKVVACHKLLKTAN